jgi:hypothetical protein
VIYRVTGIISEFVKGRFQQKIKGVLYRYRVPGPAASKADTPAAAGSATESGNLRPDQNQSPAEVSRLLRQGSPRLGLTANENQSQAEVNRLLRRADKPAAALSSSAVPSARLAPTTNVTATPVSSGQFPAAPPNADNTASTLLPAQPISSNGQVVGTSTGGGAAVVFRPQRRTTNSATPQGPQRGNRDY